MSCHMGHALGEDVPPRGPEFESILANEPTRGEIQQNFKPRRRDRLSARVPLVVGA